MALKGDTSDLDVLIFGGEPMIPLVSGFSRSRRTGVIQSSAQGGATRQRKKFYNNVYDANLSFWLESQQQQDFIKMFFERNEGKKFICHLSADRPMVEPYVIQVITTWDDAEVTAVDGLTTFAVEIFSVRDICLDDFLFPMYQCLGSDLYSVLNGMIDIVKKIPEVD